MLKEFEFLIAFNEVQILKIKSKLKKNTLKVDKSRKHEMKI